MNLESCSDLQKLARYILAFSFDKSLYVYDIHIDSVHIHVELGLYHDTDFLKVRDYLIELLDLLGNHLTLKNKNIENTTVYLNAKRHGSQIGIALSFEEEDLEKIDSRLETCECHHCSLFRKLWRAGLLRDGVITDDTNSK